MFKPEYLLTCLVQLLLILLGLLPLSLASTTMPRFLRFLKIAKAGWRTWDLFCLFSLSKQRLRPLGYYKGRNSCTEFSFFCLVVCRTFTRISAAQSVCVDHNTTSMTPPHPPRAPRFAGSLLFVGDKGCLTSAHLSNFRPLL